MALNMQLTLHIFAAFSFSRYHHFTTNVCLMISGYSVSATCTYLNKTLPDFIFMKQYAVGVPPGHQESKSADHVNTQ